MIGKIGKIEDQPEWPIFWEDYKGKKYVGTRKELKHRMEQDKNNCRIAKIKKIQDDIYKFRK